MVLKTQSVMNSQIHLQGDKTVNAGVACVRTLTLEYRKSLKQLLPATFRNSNSNILHWWIHPRITVVQEAVNNS